MRKTEINFEIFLFVASRLRAATRRVTDALEIRKRYGAMTVRIRPSEHETVLPTRYSNSLSIPGFYSLLLTLIPKSDIVAGARH